ncbi:MAG TPA: hypothetical protein VF181_09600 [Balneolaceae bacterium]
MGKALALDFGTNSIGWVTSDTQTSNLIKCGVRIYPTQNIGNTSTKQRRNTLHMKIFEEEIRYPEKGDKFFIESGDEDDIAWLHQVFQNFGGYADSYQASALSLIDTALEEQEFKDLHVYPIIFLIRHYLELRLKELIIGLSYCKSQNRHFPKTHDIQHLWSKFKQSYSEIGENTNDKRFKSVDKLIKEMSKVDPNSMTFRYPDGSDHKYNHINLNNLKETFIKVSFLFDGVAIQIAHYVDITADLVQSVYENFHP